MRLEFSTEDHWRFLSEFAAWETGVGGPDPHMVLSGEMSRNESLEERLWRGGCYISVYNAPYAEAIWREWSWERMQKEPGDLEPWLRDKFPIIETRRERRSVRRPEWMAEYFHGYARLMDRLPELLVVNDLSPEENFERFWDAALTVPRLGRYVAIKLLEYYKRFCGANLAHPDIRAEGGRSPREMLGYLFPEHSAVAEPKDTPELIELTDRLALETYRKLRDDFGVDLSMFELQVALCDYKQSWKGRRQYPGRSIDSEMAYALKMEEDWGIKSAIWEARSRVFPAVSLGEKQGWTGVRKDIAAVLATCRYTWSDLLFDYKASRIQLFHPVLRTGSDARFKSVHTLLPGKLYQSANWKKLDESQVKDRINAYGLTGIVNLWQHDSRLEDWVGAYWSVNVPDGNEVPSQVVDLARYAVAHILQGGRVLVMCHAGRNRSGLVSALIVRELLGVSGKEALDVVRRGRPRAVANDAFEDYLLELGPVAAAQPAPLAPQSGFLF